jgi:hypothetical protein
MPARSTTSEYLPSPPATGLGGKQNGRFSGNVIVNSGYIGVREMLPEPGQWTQRMAQGAPGTRSIKGPSSRTIRAISGWMVGTP